MIQPFHFTKSIGKNFHSFYEKVRQCNGVICFDFEDSINDTEPYQRTILKKLHRNNLLAKLKNICSQNQLEHIGFRINGIGTPFYPDDLDALHTLKSINCIFLPKIENSRQLEKGFRDISGFVTEIIPIIETKEGFRNLEYILEHKDFRFKRIAYGHCDYNLSNQYFPFYHQDTKQYWDWIDLLAKLAAIAGKEIINSPVLHLNDEEFFVRVLSKNKTYPNVSGQVTLCLNQTILCLISKVNKELSPISDMDCKEDRFEQAIRTIEHFENYKLKDRAFAIDNNRILISPQEYQLAKNILKDIMV